MRLHRVLAVGLLFTAPALVGAGSVPAEAGVVAAGTGDYLAPGVDHQRHVVDWERHILLVEGNVRFGVVTSCPPDAWCGLTLHCLAVFADPGVVDEAYTFRWVEGGEPGAISPGELPQQWHPISPWDDPACREEG